MTLFQQNELDKLFPDFGVGALPLGAPAPIAGPTADAARVCRAHLQHDINHYHVFFNKKRFHNHIAHHMLAIYALGGQKDVLDASYKDGMKYQRNRFDSPGPITADNFAEHVGDEDYYFAYLRFFADEVLKRGIADALDTYVFSAAYNWDGKSPQMLNRFLAGVVHPMIQVGHGTEFNVPGLLAEGLAWTAVHYADQPMLIHKNLWAQPSTLANAAQALSLTSTPKGVHSFALLARMLKDDRLRMSRPDGLGAAVFFQASLKQHGEIVAEYAAQWDAGDASDPKSVEERTEELLWLAALLYGVGGFKASGFPEGKNYKADFYTMHLVTSSIFLPSLLANLKPASKAILLKGYMAMNIMTWVSRGRPNLDIRSFYEHTSLAPPPAKDAPPVHDRSFLPRGVAGNPWTPLLERSIAHPAEHTSKTQRALAHDAAQYGRVPSGRFAGGEYELEGREVLDGTLFLRTAVLTDEVLKWVGDGGGEEVGSWARQGFYDE